MKIYSFLVLIAIVSLSESRVERVKHHKKSESKLSAAVRLGDSNCEILCLSAIIGCTDKLEFGNDETQKIYDEMHGAVSDISEYCSNCCSLKSHCTRT